MAKGELATKRTTTAPAPRESSVVTTLRNDLDLNGHRFAQLLGVSQDSQVFASWLAEVAHVISISKTLLDADRGSLIRALCHALTLGLSINPALGEAYLIPRKGIVQCQVGYRGLLALMYRSDSIDDLTVDVVYRGEAYTLRRGTSPQIDHIPDVEGEMRTNKLEDMVFAYATVRLKGSTRPIFVYVVRGELEDSRNSNLDKDGNPSTPWRDHPEAMAMKVAITRLAKILPRHNKLADLHRTLASETEHEGAEALHEEQPVKVTQPTAWEAAQAAFDKAHGVTADELLAHLGIADPSEFTSDHRDALTALFKAARDQNPDALATIAAMRQPTIEAEEQ